MRVLSIVLRVLAALLGLAGLGFGTLFFKLGMGCFGALVWASSAVLLWLAFAPLFRE